MTPLSATETDRQLVERSRAGNIAAFTQLTTTYQNPAFSAAFARRYFTQPFYVAEAFTGINGAFVSRERTIRDCVAIMDGGFDDVDESKLLYIGSADLLTRE